MTGAQPINHKDKSTPKTLQEENKAKRKNNEDHHNHEHNHEHND